MCQRISLSQDELGGSDPVFNFFPSCHPLKNFKLIESSSFMICNNLARNGFNNSCFAVVCRDCGGMPFAEVNELTPSEPGSDNGQAAESESKAQTC